MESAATENESHTNSESSSNAPTPIAEFAARPDFPHCALNQLVDIGGYTGVVIDIVHNSLKVRSPEQTTRSFNFHTLKKLYGPRVEPPAPQPPPPAASRPRSTEERQPEPEQKRNIITEPNFDAPVQRIQQLTGRSDFPQCAFGQHIDIGGYTGVVVEIVGRSLKVRSVEQTTRSYNADILKKLYPPDKL